MVLCDEGMIPLRRWCSRLGGGARGGADVYLASPLVALLATFTSSRAVASPSGEAPQPQNHHRHLQQQQQPRPPQAVLSFRGTTADFEGNLAGGAPTLVKFYTEWCAPCRSVDGPFRTLAERHPAVRFVDVDVEASLEVSALHDIRSIPTFVAFKQGRMVGRLEGANPEELAKMVADLEDDRPLPADYADPLD